MADSTRKLYWDASCFLCFLNKEEAERKAICEDILRHAKDGEIDLYTSTYTIAEVIRPKRASIPNARRLTSAEIKKIEGMFRWEWLKKIDVDQRMAFEAVTLSRDCFLLPADAIHAASAIFHKLDELQCWDRDFSKVEHLIQVSEPTIISKQTNLYDKWIQQRSPRAKADGP